MAGDRVLQTGVIDLVVSGAPAAKAATDKVVHSVDTLYDRLIKIGKTDISGVFKSLAGIGGAITGAGYGVARFATGFADMLQRGDDVANLRLGFESLTKSMGGGAEALDRLRKGFEGGLSDTEIMRAFAGADLLGVIGSATDKLDEFIRGGQMAATLFQASGKGSIAQGVQDWVTAVGKGSIQILDNLQVASKDVQIAYDNWASGVKAAGGEISREQEILKKQELMIAAVEDKYRKLGVTYADLAKSGSQAQSMIGNVTDEFLKSFAQSPQLVDNVRTFLDAIKAGLPAVAEMASGFASILTSVQGVAKDAAAWLLGPSANQQRESLGQLTPEQMGIDATTVYRTSGALAAASWATKGVNPVSAGDERAIIRAVERAIAKLVDQAIDGMDSSEVRSAYEQTAKDIADKLDVTLVAVSQALDRRIKQLEDQARVQRLQRGG